MMGTPGKVIKVPFKTNNVFNSTMMALFLPAIVSKKKKKQREKNMYLIVVYNSTMMALFLPAIVSKKKKKQREKNVSYCSVSQMHKNLEKNT